MWFEFNAEEKQFMYLIFYRNKINTPKTRAYLYWNVYHCQSRELLDIFVFSYQLFGSIRSDGSHRRISGKWHGTKQNLYLTHFQESFLPFSVGYLLNEAHLTSQYISTGLSDIKGVCTYWRASINQDRGPYALSLTITHELGHRFVILAWYLSRAKYFVTA